MEATITVDSVRTFETRSGSTRYVVKDGDGKEYTTFREHIGNAAMGLEGKRVQIEFHEEQRGSYKPFKEKVAEDIRDDIGEQ